MKKKNNYSYPAVFTYEEGQEIAVELPDFRVATSGVDDADAVKSAKELLAITILGMEEDNEEIPQPSKLNDVILEANQRSIMVEVYMPAIRFANVNRAVNRTVTLPAWLNALAVQKGINFSQMLQQALKQELGVNA